MRRSCSRTVGAKLSLVISVLFLSSCIVAAFLESAAASQPTDTAMVEARTMSVQYFPDHCEDWSLFYDGDAPILIATCYSTADPQLQCSFLDLRDCFFWDAHKNGISPKHDGEAKSPFTDVCGECVIGCGPHQSWRCSRIETTCQSHGFQRYDLWPHISNNEGILSCNHVDATRCSEKPEYMVPTSPPL
ncbi:hypothetical protein F4780DRAFT_751384 [Xylariomycetidae sp. FL0641]|nr:hypothetical protein F4780DRAFT_751384 [Xylariomycetidae sp. FL0641]